MWWKSGLVTVSLTTIHGHTYFIRDLCIEIPDKLDEVGMSIDFGEIKDYFKSRWDHNLILPKGIDGMEEILDGFTKAGISILNLMYIPATTAEGMAIMIQDELAAILGARYPPHEYPKNFISFKLFEGPNQAVEV